MKIKSTPKYGTIRKRKVFLWFPRTFWEGERPYNGKSKTLWWETIEVTEKWTKEDIRFAYDRWAMLEYRRLKEVEEG